MIWCDVLDRSAELGSLVRSRLPEPGARAVAPVTPGAVALQCMSDARSRGFSFEDVLEAVHALCEKNPVP
jgi:hypothetical protein